jgi:hypothetical protein
VQYSVCAEWSALQSGDLRLVVVEQMVMKEEEEEQGRRRTVIKLQASKALVSTGTIVTTGSVLSMLKLTSCTSETDVEGTRILKFYLR